MVFSESTNKTGMYELFQDLTKTNTASYSKYKFARDVNNAFSDYMMRAIRASGGQVDDTNQTDYNIIKLNIVSGQEDYPLTIDGSTVPNQIVDILRVELADSSGNFKLLPSYNEMAETGSITQESTMTGTPYRHRKLANGIFLDPKPNYNYTNGIYIYISRMPVYYIGDGTDDATKPGIPDAFHKYLVYLPAYLYCVTNIPKIANGYLTMVTKLEADIAAYFSYRFRDEPKRMIPNRENNR